MPPRIRVCACRTVLPSRSRPVSSRLQPHRAFADATNNHEKLPKSTDGKGPNTEQLPHISEEAAAVAKATGESGPDISQGTPIGEVVKGDKEAQKNLPKVMQDSLKKGNAGSKRTFSTLARRSFSTTSRARQDVQPQFTSQASGAATDILSTFIQAHRENNGLQTTANSSELMRLSRRVTMSEPMPQPYDFRDRYINIVDQFVGLMIQDGEKARAQRFMASILNYLRTAPAPKLNPKRPLLAGHPPADALPLNPVMYITLAIDSIAPLMRVKNIKGAAGGGRALPVPIPLNLRQRRRTAIMWVLDAVAKKPNRISGKNMFPIRVAEELVAIVQGTSAIWDRRSGLHKTSVLARANVAKKKMKRNK